MSTEQTAPPVIERRNYGRGHGYRVNGAKTPGVTTILGKTMAKEALINWAAEATAAYAVDYRDELATMTPSAALKRLKGARYEDRDTAANRGTEVHRLAAAYISGGEIDVPDELDQHVKAYEAFARDFRVVPVAVEFVVANPSVGYCGTADLLADLTDAAGRTERWLLDIKTSRSGIFPETVLQLTGYRHAEWYAAADDLADVGPMAELEVQRTGAVHVKADGTYDLVPVETESGAWEFFRHLAWCYYRLDDLQEYIGAPMRTPRIAVEA